MTEGFANLSSASLDDVVVGHIVIERLLTPDGEDIVNYIALRPDGEPLPTRETLDMLDRVRLAVREDEE